MSGEARRCSGSIILPILRHLVLPAGVRYGKIKNLLPIGEILTPKSVNSLSKTNTFRCWRAPF
jgi:hypothetical protein